MLTMIKLLEKLEPFIKHLGLFSLGSIIILILSLLISRSILKSHTILYFIYHYLLNENSELFYKITSIIPLIIAAIMFVGYLIIYKAHFKNIIKDE